MIKKKEGRITARLIGSEHADKWETKSFEQIDDTIGEWSLTSARKILVSRADRAALGWRNCLKRTELYLDKEHDKDIEPMVQDHRFKDKDVANVFTKSRKPSTVGELISSKDSF